MTLMQALFTLLRMLREDAASGLVRQETLQMADQVQRLLRQPLRLVA